MTDILKVKQNGQWVAIPAIKGEDGTDGQDGFSPSASVSKVGNTATITITDKNGTTTANVTDGQNFGGGVDGGRADSTYLTEQIIDGGNVSGQ